MRGIDFLKHCHRRVKIVVVTVVVVFTFFCHNCNNRSMCELRTVCTDMVQTLAVVALLPLVSGLLCWVTACHSASCLDSSCSSVACPASTSAASSPSATPTASATSRSLCSPILVLRQGVHSMHATIRAGGCGVFLSISRHHVCCQNSLRIRHTFQGIVCEVHHHLTIPPLIKLVKEYESQLCFIDFMNSIRQERLPLAQEQLFELNDGCLPLPHIIKLHLHEHLVR